MSFATENPGVVVTGLETAHDIVERFVQSVIDRVQKEKSRRKEDDEDEPGESDKNWKILIHQAGSEGTPFDEVEFVLGEDQLDTVVGQIVDACKSDAQDIGGGKASYVVTIEGRPGRKTFSLRVEGSTDDEEGEDFVAPNMKSAWALQLKHNAQMMRQLLSSQQEILRMNERTIRTLSEQNTGMTKDRIKNVEMYEEMMQMKHTRDLEVKREQANEMRMEQIAGTVMNALPAVANKFLGAKLVPETVTPMENQAISFVSTIRPAQIDALLKTGALDPSQVQAILALAEMVQKAEEEQLAKSKADTSPAGAAPAANGTH
jgi:hypothetical protein